MLAKDIFEFVQTEETAYKLPIEPVEGWSWNMSNHIRLSFLYKNSQFEKENENRKTRPFKNIIRPILNIQYRTEGFDVKDIELFVNDSENYYKSFLVRKFHDKWAIENGMDSFIDEVVESFVDYGGVLVKNAKGIRPEVVPLQSLAFADQTDILSGAFAIKHYFSPSQLRDMKNIWDNAAIENAILQAENSKKQDKNNIQSKTPTKYVEVYEIHGQFPDSWIGGEQTDRTSPQIHIVSFYKDDNGTNQGIHFFNKKEPVLPFKFLARDKVFGRALGFGGVEELFEAQVWTNYTGIHKMRLLESSSKNIYKTTDTDFAAKNKTLDTDNNEVLKLQQGTDIGQVDTYPRNAALFNQSIQEFELHARQMGAAGEALMGESPSAGTPFKLQELVVSEAKSLHHWRRGKLAVFTDEIYREWVIPHIQREVVKEQYFVSELTADEMQEVVEKVVNSRANKIIVGRILDDVEITQDEILAIKERIRNNFLAGGAKRFLKILKDEMKETPLDVATNIAGKQKDLALMTDKLVNVFRQLAAAPQILDDPRLARIFNKILESSGISPIGFSGASVRPPIESLKELGAQTIA